MNKVVIIGLGYVGKAYAYSLITQNKIKELVLIDADEEKLLGNYIDLKDAATLTNVKVTLGSYNDCKDADIVTICAGRNQVKGETRLELLKGNNEIIKNITENVVKEGFDGIFLVATNPVDVLTYLVYKYSGFKKEKVIGSGTFLDTIRLKRILNEELNLSEIETYVLGEHGDSSFPVWSNTTVNRKNINSYLNDEKKSLIEKKVQNVAYEIINKKGETSYGIGSALAYLTNVILEDKTEKVVISSITNDISVGNVCVLGKEGIKLTIDLTLSDEELEKYNKSKQVIKNAINSLED